MARDPKRTLQTLSAYRYREEQKERERRSIIEAFRAADLPMRVFIVIFFTLFIALAALFFYYSDKSNRAPQTPAEIRSGAKGE